MFKLIHKNKKGFTLFEMMVTLVIFGIVAAMAGTLLYQLTNFNNMATYRYEIQNAVKMAYTKFETNRDSIVQSYQTDVLYDPVIAAGITVTNNDPDNFTFTWNGVDGKTAPLAMTADSNGEYYTYIFSTPAQDENGNNLGSLLFIKEYSSDTCELYLNPEGMGTLPVEILFTMGTNAPKASERVEGDYRLDENPTKYVTHSVGVIIKSGRDDITNYSVDTAYTLENIMQNKKSINFKGGKLVKEDAWGTDGTTGPAGWVNGQYVLDENGAIVISGDGSNLKLDNYPTSSQLVFSETEASVAEEERIQEYGNIMRFISPEAYFSDSSIDSKNADVSSASCIAILSMEGSEMADRVLGNLRNFRDTVLRGTTFGDWFIDNYYHTWSPFLVEHTAFLKPLYKAVLIPTSYICDFIAKL